MIERISFSVCLILSNLFQREFQAHVFQRDCLWSTSLLKIKHIAFKDRARLFQCVFFSLSLSVCLFSALSTFKESLQRRSFKETVSLRVKRESSCSMHSLFLKRESAARVVQRDSVSESQKTLFCKRAL